MQSSRKLFAAVATVAAMMCAPAAAQAAVSATLSGDDGQPVVLNPSAPLALRYTAPTLTVTIGNADAESWKVVVTGPNGTPGKSEICWEALTRDSSGIKFLGNGTYTITVALFSKDKCESPKSTTTYTYNLNASVSVGQPAGAFATRPVNSPTTNVQYLDFAGNPGTTQYEIRYALNGTIGPDGAIAGPSNAAYIDSTTGKIRLGLLDTPGTYVVVARGQASEYFTPWSAPVTLKLVAPFDLTSRVWYPDSRGPSFQLSGTVREKALIGSKVTVAWAKGKTGKRFHTLGKAKVNSERTFKLRFRLKRGTYRLRYSYSGSSLVARGTYYQALRITRRPG
jgi:hypothetical protein